jgi:MFS family permease
MQHSLSKEQFKIIVLSSLGGALEFFDFVIFAIFAKEIGAAFFPHNTDPMIDVIDAFAIFAIGYIFRPLGGIIFSHIGDKYGRKNSFLLTIIIMSIATLSMSLMPTYADIGIMATIVFTLLRIIQGMALGGEIPDSITFVKEHINTNPGFAIGFIFMFINFGIFLADGVHALLVATLSPADFVSYGWRIAFVVGGLVALMSYLLRTKLNETPEFERANNRDTSKVPIKLLFTSHFSSVVNGILVISIQATIISMVYLYMTTYMQLTKLYTAADISSYTLITLAIFSVGVAIFGFISDLWSRKKLFILGTVATVVSAFLAFYGLSTATLALPYYILLSITTAIVIGTSPAILAHLFPVEVRFSGIALSYNVSFAFFGGITPFLASYFINATGSMLVPAFIILMAAILGLIGAMRSHEITSRLPS